VKIVLSSGRTPADAIPSGRHEIPGGRSTSPTWHGLVGQSKALRALFPKIERVAGSNVTVCISGESGTGKELIARAIHELSNRRDRPFITLDCTTIPEGLVESQLFGHKKGAFTGAVSDRDGVFSLAQTGTLFIDEISELKLPLQAKLLRVIQSREFSKVGANTPTRTDVRLIAATNKDLQKSVIAGTFREDLYYRIGVVGLRVPPLQERKEDIPLLVEHFVDRFSMVYKKAIRAIDPLAMDQLMALSWPGNVRQLQNFIEQAVVLAESDTLGAKDLFGEDHSVSRAEVSGTLHFELGLPLEEVERRYILETLQKLGGSRIGTAQLLGISLRCLQYKLKSYSTSAPGPEANGQTQTAIDRVDYADLDINEPVGDPS
jgi:transcriptional regulator with PAS, ATPase and Fis domain